MSDKLNSSQILLIATFISILIAKDKTDEQLDFLANLLICIGTNLLTIAASNVLMKSESSDQRENEPEIT